MNNPEIARICHETMDQVAKVSVSDRDFNENMGLLVSGLLSISARSIELMSGGDGVRDWFTLISGIVSKSMEKAYTPPSTISISFVVAEKSPGV